MPPESEFRSAGEQTFFLAHVITRWHADPLYLSCLLPLRAIVLGRHGRERDATSVVLALEVIGVVPSTVVADLPFFLCFRTGS